MSVWQVKGRRREFTAKQKRLHSLLGMYTIWQSVTGLYYRCNVFHLPEVAKLERYFNATEIIKRAISLRLKIAKKRHDQHFLYNMNEKFPTPHYAEPRYDRILGMMPPRSEWLRPNLETRIKFDSLKCSELSIQRAITRARRISSPPDWLNNLDIFVAEVQSRAQNPVFDAPNIHFVPKDEREPDGPNKKYRPIAIFSPRDQIVIGIASKQLRDVIDPLFLDSSYAFRGRKGEHAAPTHHDAVEDLLGFIKFNQSKLLYVAECDIQKFYDSVNHATAKKELKKLLLRARLQRRAYDKRLLSIFDAYLHSYDFQELVPSAFKAKNKEGQVPWVKKELETYYSAKQLMKQKVGVPQGGALSTIIANIVLHSADLAVRKAARANRINDEEYFYARYCDDMILVSTSRETSEILFEVYLKELKRLKLPYHAPADVVSFSPDFFEKMKSKEVYAYGSPSAGSVSPWLSFLGYQIRYDGRLRIRKRSLTKELEKQREIYKKVVRAIKCNGENIRVSGRQALHRSRLRLIAMSVGKVGIHFHGPFEEHQMCWVSGFQLLKKHRFVTAQIRRLDRNRARLLSKLQYKLKKVRIKTTQEDRSKAHTHYGRPFSYYGQFRNKV